MEVLRMQNTKEGIEFMIKQLPDDSKKEVFDYIEFLISKHRNSNHNSGKFKSQ